MSGIQDYADKRIEAERKLIADWLIERFSSPSNCDGPETIALAAYLISRGEYRTKDKAV
jgi:hypothetical protein